MDRLNNVSRRNTETVNGNNRTTALYPQSVLPSAVSVVLVDPVLPSGKRSRPMTQREMMDDT